MAKKKELTVENLTALGVETLARILVDEAGHNKLLKRELIVSLKATDGPQAIAREVTKRIGALARSETFVDGRQVRTLARDFEQQRSFIVDKIAPADPDLALDLMWRFLDLAEPTFERCDDSSGIIGTVFWDAVEDLGEIAARSAVDRETMADTVVARLLDNGYGVYDSLTAAMLVALGQTGAARLKERMTALRQSLDAYGAPADDNHRSSGVWHHQRYAIDHCLQTLADAVGDVDAFIATHDEKALSNPVFVSRIALRLVAADRAEEALVYLDRAKPKNDFGLRDWHDARIEACLALGDKSEAQALRWHMFETFLAPRYLRDYLGDLPDFDDVEAEAKALTWVESVDDVHRALAFLVNWPDLERAARVVVGRHTELDGNLYYVSDPAADALEGRYPLAAVLLRRALVEHTLNGAKSTRYKHAVRHIRHMEGLAEDLLDTTNHESHAAFMERLRAQHAPKTGFWRHLE
jgi:hypothetical protein